MKKVTLGAIVWALAMMGCSESGMDNSVASSIGAAQQGPVIEFAEIPNLQAVVDDCPQNVCGDTDYNYFRRVVLWGHTYHYRQELLVNSVNQGYAKIMIAKDAAPTKADLLYIRTICVQDCDDFGNCKEVSGVGRYTESSVPVSVSNAVENRCIDELPRGKSVGVVSTFAATFNPGKHDEIVLQATTYKNLGQEQAMWVYRNYLYPVLLQDAGL